MLEGLWEGHLPSCPYPPTHRIPLRRVYTGSRTLNPLRGWGNPEEPLGLGAPSPGGKSAFVPLSNYMNVSVSPTAPSSEPRVKFFTHPLSFPFFFFGLRPSITGKLGWGHPHKTSLSSSTLAPPTSGSHPGDATSSVCPAVSFRGGRIRLSGVQGRRGLGLSFPRDLGAPFSSDTPQ